MAVRIRTRRDTAANWTSANPVLALGEMGVETDTKRVKVGDGLSVWTSLPYFTALTPSSSVGSPSLITAAGGIGVSGIPRELQFIAGNGGPVVVTANPQVAVGTVVGQELIVFGVHATNAVTLANGNGLALNGLCKLWKRGSLYLIWDGALWSEVSRNDV